MARLQRYFAPHMPLHIIQRGNDRQPLFTNESDLRFFCDCLQENARKRGLAIHAYVFMSNHFHLLATPENASSAAKTLQSVGRRYVQHFNRRWGHTGTRWEGRYRATVVDSEAYMLICSRYIELNPVRAGMVEHPHDFRWSSYRHNAHGVMDQLVTTHPLFLELGSTLEDCRLAYRGLFQYQLDEQKLNDIRSATNKGWALGGDEFKKEVERLTLRRAKPLRRGGRKAAASRSGVVKDDDSK